MPNPSEMERNAQERSEQYAELQRTRNAMPRMGKQSKEAALQRVRALEQSLGIKSCNYNGNGIDVCSD